MTPPFHLLSRTLRHLPLVHLSGPTRSHDVISKSDTQKVLLSNFLTQAILWEPLLAVCLSCLQKASYHTVHGYHHPSVCMPDHEITCSWPSACFKLGKPSPQPGVRPWSWGHAVMFPARQTHPQDCSPSHQLTASSCELFLFAAGVEMGLHCDTSDSPPAWWSLLLFLLQQKWGDPLRSETVSWLWQLGFVNKLCTLLNFSCSPSRLWYFVSEDCLCLPPAR